MNTTFTGRDISFVCILAAMIVLLFGALFIGVTNFALIAISALALTVTALTVRRIETCYPELSGLLAQSARRLAVGVIAVSVMTLFGYVLSSSDTSPLLVIGDLVGYVLLAVLVTLVIGVLVIASTAHNAVR